MDLRNYDVILLNTSAGKDSLAMLDYVYSLAVEQGVTDRLQAVHCDLGRMEWQGTRELAHRQCERYSIPLRVISREQDLLAHVEQRGKWPSAGARYCTSDHKRDQVGKVITALVNGHIQTLPKPRKGTKRAQVRVLNCLGLRAQESPKRRDMMPFEINERATNGKRLVHNWLPIHQWTESEVWQHIHSRGLEYHRAYDLGMPRLSCVFCIFAPTEALLLAGYHNRALLSEYVAVESRIGHTFKHKQPLFQIQQTLNSGYVPRAVAGDLWEQCA